MFNIFINDIFDFVKKGDLHNYADDNTLSYGSNSVDDVIETLEEQSDILIKWFTENHMQANPDKFQAISIGRKTHEKNLSFMLQGNKIDCEDEVKLLGVTFDFRLTLNSHVSHICKKASQQLNVLRDRPFNLKRGGGGGYGFLFRSAFFFRTTRELVYLFFCRPRKREIFFQNSTLGYMTKTLNQIIVFPPPKSEYFFQRHWESEYFFRKKAITPPPPPSS